MRSCAALFYHKILKLAQRNISKPQPSTFSCPLKPSILSYVRTAADVSTIVNISAVDALKDSLENIAKQVDDYRIELFYSNKTYLSDHKPGAKNAINQSEMDRHFPT